MTPLAASAPRIERDRSEVAWAVLEGTAPSGIDIVSAALVAVDQTSLGARRPGVSVELHRRRLS